METRAGFRGGPRAPGLPPKGGLPPNPSIFISQQASHQLNPALMETLIIVNAQSFYGSNFPHSCQPQSLDGWRNLKSLRIRIHK